MLTPEEATDHPDIEVDRWLVPHRSWIDAVGTEWHEFLKPRPRRGTNRRELWVSECAMRKQFPDLSEHLFLCDGSRWLVAVEHEASGSEGEGESQEP